MTATVPEVRTRKHRFIERPRLLALLDESRARIKTLVAPAGYGKTTLAEQWVARGGRSGAWYTARSASTDVAALALGLARSSTAIVEGCDVRLREHLRALPDPAESVETLAEILAEDLESWPESAWLVIDDYHEIAEEPGAELFVEALVLGSAIQCVIVGRQRPAWVSTKMLLYGDVVELSQTALAMDTTEASEVLVEHSEPSASGLVSLANGWPAVIGIASVSEAEIRGDLERMPESLYQYFAEEVFGSLRRDVQAGLTTLSVAPLLDRRLAGALLGSDAAASVCAAALDIGILVERGPRLELHPLVRTFLEERSGSMGFEPAEDSAGVCLTHYRAHRDWDAAFEVIVRRGLPDALEGVLSAALDELLDTARLSTVRRWCEFAAAAGVESPIVQVAKAEMTLRNGRHIEAIAYAEAAATRSPELAFRAIALAGRAAHLASREEQALDLYRRAQELASDDDARREAMWGELMCLVDLENPAAVVLLEDLAEGVTLADPREYVRAAAHRMHLQFRVGPLDLDEADVAYQLLAAVEDPLVASSFLSAYATALALTGRYREARDVACELLAAAERHRFAFAVPYGLCAFSIALAGLRDWERAEQAARDALNQAAERRDVYVGLLSASVLLRLYAQQARIGDALELTPSVSGALCSSLAELNCSRALVLACAGRKDEALELVNAGPTSSAVEPVILAGAVDAVLACRSGSGDAIECVRRFEALAFELGAVDLLVVAYRACPELLAVLLRLNPHGRLPDLLRRVGDADLARVSGVPVAEEDDRTALLSPRERDVYDLLCTGLTNRQIAKALFIEPSTVKVHTLHIYDKLGVRSRRALAVQAVLGRRGQATSATASTESGAAT